LYGSREKTLHDDTSKQVYIRTLKNESTKLQIWKWKRVDPENHQTTWIEPLRYYVNEREVTENEFIDILRATFDPLARGTEYQDVAQ
jgi:hypothetical protein